MLDAVQQKRLADSFNDVKDDIEFLEFEPTKYLVFLERVTRQYLHLWNKLSDPLHLRRDDTLESSVNTVLRQVRPKTFLPHDGKMDVILQTISPLVENSLLMPSGTVERGTKRWVAKVIRDRDFSLANMVMSRDVLKAFISVQVKGRGLPGSGFPRCRGACFCYSVVTHVMLS